MREDSFLSFGRHGLHRVAYSEWTPDGSDARKANSGATVVCVHGLSGNGRVFDDLAGSLTACGLRVVCPDMAGRGKSEWLSHKRDYGFPLYLADVVTLVARLGVAEIDWVGTSMGGALGMMLAAQPQTPIRRLVLNDVGTIVPRASLSRIRKHISALPRFADLGAAEAYLRDIYSASGEHSDGQWRRFTAHSVRREGDGSYRLDFDPAILSPLKRFIWFDIRLWHLWDRITCPVLLLRGSESRVLTREVAEEMGRRGPPVKLVEFEGLGHAPSLMVADQICVVRDWLTSAG